ncbi:M56 family metallopeptidase [Virgibacillus sp. AGTR]|uniref:M56 family metallopeptidase n=1 Tax=Virgibacillus salarius TaxID=447199 RepID=A0A941DSX7_9BACI|nr:MULTISPECIES: M56 family metallopeptidase [Virgibacillus]MBR7795126.1 M56 family metallopeptidase [Virgibacillus salarius]MCC2249328.1 M56 family metallopeptidase [Virgibacillus sp. AGTR]NAZ07842.1 hypothetical protein [Agaribacter marinus]QRZ18870.1 M56 family metallopeptidase [Virgibacillus sp. AGTR]
MVEYLTIIIGLSIAGSSVLLFSLFITYLSKRTLSSKWYYRNRKLSLFFFLVPVFLVSDLLSVINSEDVTTQYIEQSIIFQPVLSLTTAFFQVVVVVWVIGVTISSLRFIYIFMRFTKKLKASCFSVPKENIVYDVLRKQMENMNLNSPVEIVFCRLNISPIIIGVFKPTIVLPMHDILPDELEMIIKHELIHYKRKDLWVKRAALLATILHWYNPFVYILQKEINKWSELSCDEDVVIKMSHRERKKYGETILNMIYRSNQETNPYLLGTFFATGQVNLRKRLLRILEAKKVSKSIVFLSFIIFIAIGSGSVVSANLIHKNINRVSEVVLFKAGIDKSTEEQEEGSNYEINSVKKSDESKFSREDWEEILKQVENGEIVLEDE